MGGRQFGRAVEPVEQRGEYAERDQDAEPEIGEAVACPVSQIGVIEHDHGAKYQVAAPGGSTLTRAGMSAPSRPGCRLTKAVGRQAVLASLRSDECQDAPEVIRAAPLARVGNGRVVHAKSYAPYPIADVGFHQHGVAG